MMDFDRIRGCIFALHLCLTIMGAAFMFEVLRGGSPITPELYGARVHAIDAWIWAAFQVAACGVAATGALVGGRGGAAMVIIGGLASAAMFAFFARMAMEAPQGTLAFFGSAFLTTPLSTLSGVSAYNYLRGRDDG